MLPNEHKDSAYKSYQKAEEHNADTPILILILETRSQTDIKNVEDTGYQQRASNLKKCHIN